MNTQYDPFGRPVRPEPELYDDPSPNALSLAALVCGVLAILSFCVGGAIIPAALGVLFALLSRKKRMCGQAKIGFFLSLGALAVYVLALLFLVGTLAITGILGPVTEKALQTDFTDPDSVAEFQEETYRLLDSLLERYSRFLPEEYVKQPAAEKPQAAVEENSAHSAFVTLGSRPGRRLPSAPGLSPLSGSECRSPATAHFAGSSFRAIKPARSRDIHFSGEKQIGAAGSKPRQHLPEYK